jgi:hypothetical protein
VSIEDVAVDLSRRRPELARPRVLLEDVAERHVPRLLTVCHDFHPPAALEVASGSQGVNWLALDVVQLIPAECARPLPPMQPPAPITLQGVVEDFVAREVVRHVDAGKVFAQLRTEHRIPR